MQNVVFAVGVGVLALYVPMSLGEYARLVVAVVVVQSIYVALVVPSFARQIAPLVHWLDGDRAEGAAAAAWRSAASLPFDFIRHQLRHLFVLIGSVAWCLLAVWQLDLPIYALPI